MISDVRYMITEMPWPPAQRGLRASSPDGTLFGSPEGVGAAGSAQLNRHATLVFGCSLAADVQPLPPVAMYAN